MARTKNYQLRSSVKSDPPLIVPLRVEIPRDPSALHNRTSVFDFGIFQRHEIAARSLAGAFYQYYSQMNDTETPHMGFWNLRTFFSFLDLDKGNGHPITTAAQLDDELLERYGTWLYVYNKTASARTNFTFFSVARKLLREAARIRGTAFPHIRSPFSGVNETSERTPQLSPTEYASVLKAARLEAYSTWKAFSAFHSGRTSESEAEFLTFVNEKCDGICPGAGPARFPKNGRLLKVLQSLGGQRAVAPKLYSTPRSLVPFLLLIAQETIANPAALRGFQRNCIAPIPILSDVYQVTWDKGRSPDIQSSTVGGRGFWSVPNLINMVLTMSEPLLRHAPAQYKNCLFLAWTHNHGVTLPHLETFGLRLQEFAEDHDLKADDGNDLVLNFENIRPTEMTADFKRRGDLRGLQRRAGHRHLSTTYIYIVQRHTEDMHDGMIAGAQKKFVKKLSSYQHTDTMSLEQPQNAISLNSRFRVRAAHVSHICRDPYDAPKSPGQRCPSWLLGLTDPGLVIPEDDKYIARLVQLNSALSAAKCEMSSARFAALYEDVFQILNEELLPRFSADRIALAKLAAAELPALPNLATE